MPSSYTPYLQLVLPVTGDLDGTWGSTVNTELTENIEAAVAGYSTNAFAASPDNVWTLTVTSITGQGAPHESRSAILICTGTPGETCYINAPKNSKTYVVINNSDSTVYLRGGPTSPTAGTFILAGQSALCAWNGSDFVKVAGGSGGATGGGTNQAFFNNDVTITTSYTIPTGKNSGTFGPVTIASGATVTIPDDSVWSIV